MPNPTAPTRPTIADPTPDQRMKIRNHLDKSFDDGAGMYLDGMSDQAIATAVGVPRRPARGAHGSRGVTGSQHIVNVSGGKDSTACYLMAARMGNRLGNWRAVMADTGNEHEATMEYASRLHEQVEGGAKVEFIRADFSADMARKRSFMAEKWRGHGVPQAIIDRAIALLHPTGSPFLDLCMLKGRFPSRKAQFCTGELKVIPTLRQIVMPALQVGPVIQWTGVRRDESRTRTDTPLYRHGELRGLMTFYPIRHWTAAQVFSFLGLHGVQPNPLYTQGMGRVGCMPCINCSKGELGEISRRFPGHIDRIAEWESIVALVSKRGLATFFAASTDPLDTVRGGYAGIRQIAEWAQTKRGGRQFGIEAWIERQSEPSCGSVYGLCE